MSLISFDKERELKGTLQERKDAAAAAEDRALKAEKELQAFRLATEEEKKKKEDETAEKTGALESRLRDLEAQAAKDRATHVSVSTAYTDEIGRLRDERDGARAERDSAKKALDTQEKDALAYAKSCISYRDSAELVISDLTIKLRNREAEQEILFKGREESRRRLQEAGEEKKKVEEEKASLVQEVEKLKEELKKMTPAAPGGLSTEAIAAYKTSVDFITLKAEMCEMGFTVCKHELISQGLVTEAALEPLSFISTISKMAVP